MVTMEHTNKPTSLVQAELRELIEHYVLSFQRGEEPDHQPVIRYVLGLAPEERSFTACAAAALLCIMDLAVRDLSRRGKAPDERELLDRTTIERAEKAQAFVGPVMQVLAKDFRDAAGVEQPHHGALSDSLQNFKDRELIAVLSATLLAFSGLLMELQGEAE